MRAMVRVLVSSVAIAVAVRIARGGADAELRPVHAAELPRRGADRAAGARDQPRRPRRHDGRVRPLPARRRRRQLARHVSGVAATSVQGRPLRYAIVGRPERVTSTGLAAVRASAAKLMDPRTSDREAAQIAASDPAILWIAANVHGGEESGTDASLRVLYELADRSDCAAQRILDQAVVVILPIQNPDGREADSRRNAYGFDMNRDWFARTQPETDGKVELLRRYPGVLFIDAHEFGGTNDYFFPPNADPVYHDIADPAVDWINDIYGAAMQDEFDERGIPYFNYDTYDLFYAGYGDTVPATGFGAAGMTFEKANGDPAPAAGARAVHHPVDLALGRRDQQGADPARVARGVGRGRAPGRGRRARAQPDLRAGRARQPAGARPHASATTSCARTTRTRRARSRGWCAACSGWTSRSAACRRRWRCPTSAPTGARRRRRRCPPARTGSRWRSARSTGSRRCSTRAPTRRSATPTTSSAGAARCCSTWPAARRARCSRRGTPSPGAQAEPAPPALPAKRPSIAIYSMSPQFVARDRVLGLAALAARPLGRRLPRRVGDRHRHRRPERRRGPARARRLRAQGPERPVGSLRLQGPRAEGPREPEGVGAERRPLRRLARRRRARLRAGDLRHGLRRRRRRRASRPRAASSACA